MSRLVTIFIAPLGRGLALLWLCMLASASSISAGPSGAAMETWIGIEAAGRARSAYAGFTWAPFGLVQTDGWRLRGTTGYGAYAYTGRIDSVDSTIRGAVSFGDVLLGYQVGLGALTLKAFGGVTFDSHDLRPFDPGNAVNDTAIGAKVALEAWLNLTSRAWASVDLSAATAHESYFGRLRLGYRVLDQVSLGIEGGAFGNAASDNGRGGGFVRYEWAGGELSVSAGVSGNIERPDNPYGTLMLLTRF